MSALDRALRFLGLQRLPVAQRNHFLGAATSRLLSQWGRTPLSADKELASDFQALRGRARDLARNNPYAKRFVRMARAHVVGPKGVQLRPAVAFVNGRPHDTLNDAIWAAWADWCKPQHASASGRLSFAQLQRLAVSEWATCGESVTLLRYDRRYKYGVALQPIDSDRIDHTFNRPRNPRTGANEVRMGVELDDAGRPVAYHILDVHPSEIGSSFAREQARRQVPAELVIHLFKNDERVELTRGVPELAVALRDLRHLDGFQEAALVKMRTAAAAMGFIVTKGDGADATTPEEGLEFAAEAGIFRELGLGQELQSWDPKEPATSFGDFTKAILRSTAAGLGTSYAMLANDLSDANYSSMRVGRHEEQETWKELQGWFIDQWCERVYPAWLTSAALSGALSVGGESRDITAREWIPRRWASVDPVKDIEADERRVALGVASRQGIAARDGDDYWQIIEEREEEEAYAREHGVDVAPLSAQGASNGEQATDDAADAAPNDDGDRGRGGARHARRGRRPDSPVALVRAAGGAVVWP